MRIAKFEELTGKTLTKINAEKEIVTFTCGDGSEFEMRHQQECCETVCLEDGSGLEELVGQKVVYAYEASSSGRFEYGTCRWTFYTIQGERTAATMRWYGESNGYYSEGVSFYCTKEAHKNTPSRFNLSED